VLVSIQASSDQTEWDATLEAQTTGVVHGGVLYASDIAPGPGNDFDRNPVVGAAGFRCGRSLSRHRRRDSGNDDRIRIAQQGLGRTRRG
jgi:hypothetical protein